MNTKILQFWVLVLGAILPTSCNNDDTFPFQPSSSTTVDTLRVDTTRKINLRIGVGIEGGAMSLGWTPFDDVIYYELEESLNETFTIAFMTYRGPHNDYFLGRPYTGMTHFRVRAVFAESISPWSKDVALP